MRPQYRITSLKNKTPQLSVIFILLSTIDPEANLVWTVSGLKRGNTIGGIIKWGKELYLDIIDS